MGDDVIVHLRRAMATLSASEEADSAEVKAEIARLLGMIEVLDRSRAVTARQPARAATMATRSAAARPAQSDAVAASGAAPASAAASAAERRTATAGSAKAQAEEEREVALVDHYGHKHYGTHHSAVTSLRERIRMETDKNGESIAPLSLMGSAHSPPTATVRLAAQHSFSSFSLALLAGRDALAALQRAAREPADSFPQQGGAGKRLRAPGW